MSWQGIEGHDHVAAALRRALERGRLASTFLFVGPPGIGKRSFALQLAHALLCLDPPHALEPCLRCASCAQWSPAGHPDLSVVSRPPDKASIPLEAFLGRPERRMQEGLCHDLAMKPFVGGRKVAMIDDADALNVEGANCLLKTLEEPPPKSVLILISTAPEKQLPTIRSRAQIVRFLPLQAPLVARLLLEQGVAPDQATADRLAEHCQGSLVRAAELADPALWTFREQWLPRLTARGMDSVRMAKETNAFLDEAGKDAAARRARARQILLFAVEHFRERLRSAAEDVAGESASEVVAPICERWTACIERCLDALDHVDRNAHLVTVIDTWLDDLRRQLSPTHAYSMLRQE